jgi:phosphate-selective porin OprO/OprP
LDAWFANISWFITGEHKNYNPSKSAFDRVHPKKNFGDNGIGSFEIALRYSSIDFDDADLNGGRMNDFTAGLNWYLNPAVRFTFNYIHSTLKEIGEANIFQTRFQVTF